MPSQSQASIEEARAEPDFVGNRLFRGLDPSLVQKLAAIPEVDTLEPGQVVFEEGDHGQELYLIAAGSIRISKQGAGGRQQTLTTLGAGDYFGEMALLDPAPRSARATALAPTRLGRLDAEGLRTMLEADPLELARNLMIDAVQRLRDADRLLIDEVVRAERLSLLGTMTASIMHDLKNPLSVISGVAQLLEMDGRDDHGRWSAMLERAVVGITALVQDVLDYARGTSHIEIGDVPAELLLRDLAELLAQRMSARGVELTSEIEVERAVRVDRQRFGRVLANISTNAVEAMRDGGTLHMTVAPREGRVCFTVTDTGPGIPDAILPTLFEPFVTHGKKGGTGLGMAIAKAIVEAHQGEITVSNAPQGGARFEIVVP